MPSKPPDWKIEFHDDFDPEYDRMDSDVQDALLAALKAIRLAGPRAGRPYVDTLNGSKHANMKELRFDAKDGSQVWRAAFAFDPARKAIVLVAGDKQGKNRERFYKRLIATADGRFDSHLEVIRTRLKRK